MDSSIFQGLIEPHFGQDLIQAKAKIAVEANRIALEIGFPCRKEIIESWLKSRVSEPFQLDLNVQIQSHQAQGQVKPIAGVKNVIAVASGKGGVGKSAVAANLAVALAQEGARVGILDADIYGPSQPLMFGIQQQQPELDGQQRLVPVNANGIQVMSIGLIVNDPDASMIWRGPMVNKALLQMALETAWQDLDYLVIDLPPGTGDTQLTLVQNIPLTGAVIVTTPQDIALLDAAKGLSMFKKTNVHVLGVIENMSTHICSQCGHEEAIFGDHGGEQLAEKFEVPLLGQIPLDIAIRRSADAGMPLVAANPTCRVAEKYAEIGRTVAARISLLPRRFRTQFPDIVVEKK